MPIINMYGFTDEDVKKLAGKANVLAKMINAKSENMVFIKVEAKLYAADAKLPANEQPRYIYVDWVGRPILQDEVAKFFDKTFKAKYKNVWVRFNELNTFLYVNGEHKA